ncbi:MAG: glycosyl hydrolase family 95 catalytic domain-containing protein [Planctomycetota bacterium]
MAPLPEPIRFALPAASPHEGMPLGNGTLGALLWNGKHQPAINVTINRQDYWQHAGKIAWKPAASYQALCTEVRNQRQSSDAPDLIDFVQPDMPAPTRLPMGRFDLPLNAPPRSATLDVAAGQAIFDDDIRAVILPHTPICLVLGTPGQIQPVPNDSPEVQAYRSKYNMAEPIRFADGDLSGWVQISLDGQAMCAAAMRRDDAVYITSVLAEDQAAAKQLAIDMLRSAPGPEEALQLVRRHYQAWWDASARIRTECRSVNEMYDLGLFKLSGLVSPESAAPTLQGAWVEDDCMPPWRGDYHFNVNVQMAHWPMLPTNHLELFNPLVRMLDSWRERMGEYARIFAGVEDGLMLPHAVDDRCIPADRNWRCQFDPGSVGWTALELWRLYQYGGDRELLARSTWPLIRGALRTYQGLLEKRDGKWSLPMGPNPEYWPVQDPANMAGRDQQIVRDWGPNASFQVAICHGLLDAAIRCVDLLGLREPQLETWLDIRRSLPRYAETNGRIGLFEGQDLEFSHRHHSHLGGIFPFQTLDVDGADREIIDRSITRWVKIGPGEWTGWCMPWAAILWAHLGQAQAAAGIVQNYRRFFTGPNHASRHDAVAAGYTAKTGSPHVMQIDAAMGIVAAICEMCAHQRGGDVRLAPAVPASWGEVQFETIRLPGGRFASGTRIGGKWQRLEVTEASFEL